MKPKKLEYGDVIGARDFNHGERSRRIRRASVKKATRRFIKDLNKAE